MKKVVLVHWKPQEAPEKIALLEGAGYEVSVVCAAGPVFLKELEALRPAAVIIDLSRLPSQGRDLAVAIRLRKGTRQIPLVLAGGDPAKVEGIQTLLPDAIYCSWENLIDGLKEAEGTSRTSIVVPESAFAGYTGRPLAQKLGVRPQSRVALIGAPEGFVDELGDLPQGVEMVTCLQDPTNLVIWFIRSQAQLAETMSAIVEGAKQAPTWIAWPKKGVRGETDLTQTTVRRVAMAAGLVDYKICAIDEEWSALLFKWRGLG